MGNLLLNSLEVHHSRAFRDLKKERLGRVDLLVGKHNVGQTVTAHQQAGSANFFHVAKCNKSAKKYEKTGKTGMKQPTGVKNFRAAKCNILAMFHDNASKTGMKSIQWPDHFTYDKEITHARFRYRPQRKRNSNAECARAKGR